MYVAQAKFLFYMRAIQLYVILILCGLFWLAVITLCRPFKSRRSNQLAILSGTCWVMITGIAELISEGAAEINTTNKHNAKEDGLLLAVMSTAAALTPTISFLVLLRLSDPAKGVDNESEGLYEQRRASSELMEMTSKPEGNEGDVPYQLMRSESGGSGGL